MPSAPLPPNELDRLAELDRYAIFSTPPETAFDQITQLASYAFQCPVAILNFIDGDGQWFKSVKGVDFNEGPRSESICAWAILGNSVMVVPDATQDPRFRGNPLVTGTAGIRFYAGAPLISQYGYNLGTLCVMDTKARPEGLTTADIAALTTMASLAMGALEARLVARASDDNQALLQTALSRIGDGVIATDAESRITFLNPVAEQLTGWKLDEAVARPIEEVFRAISAVRDFV